VNVEYSLKTKKTPKENKCKQV